MIAIVDTGGANLASLRQAVRRLGRAAVVTSSRSEIESADRVLLPGVGHAGFAMAKLRAAGLIEPLRSLAQPVLGICLGMQILFETSEEGDSDCLGVLPGKVFRLPSSQTERRPHMGWNDLELRGPKPPLLEGVADGASFYFVHSFAVPDGPWVRAVTRDARAIPSMVQERNFWGTQFHPERSGPDGARLLANFLGGAG